MYPSVVDGINIKEFKGFESVSSLWSSGYGAIPPLGGVYVVLRAAKEKPIFLNECPVPMHDGKPLAYGISQLQARWVDGATVVYVGKATNLRSRLRTYCQFGEGKPRPHRGGRSIWQLSDARSLVIAWSTIGHCDPAEEESRLIEQFKSANHGKRPYANVRD